ncbi:stage III sporulation protein AF [Paenibacillus nanensis]|uniref:stage III sporulation protein AF n=1 Tax=Paenibacillus nanensis TaxID=393251 RepID=UPI0013C2A760|nr:stage III sporulation protein AF [Paenibacillus nanensis]
MIGWLSDWLRNIIAVILLAMLVELLLPNKAMQRYARLVVGLFILLTILSPILKLLQTDMSDRLEAGMELWDERSMTRDIKMPSLEDIQKRADAIQAQRNVEAAKLTAMALEESMSDAIAEETGMKVESVDVKLILPKAGEEEKQPELASVTVTLESREAARESSGQEPVDIEAVAPVQVDVSIQDTAEPVSGQMEQQENGFVQVSQSEANAIYGVLAKGFGVQAAQTVIRERAGDGAGH